MIRLKDRGGGRDRRFLGHDCRSRDRGSVGGSPSTSDDLLSGKGIPAESERHEKEQREHRGQDDELDRKASS
jgi:hypothetical protein